VDVIQESTAISARIITVQNVRDKNMSRSYRNNSIIGWSTADSEKLDKRKANRRFRKKSKYKDIRLMREVSEEYSFAKDGKQYFGRLEESDPNLYEKLMRK